MKHEYTEGCILTSLLIDGSETIDISTDTFKDAIQELFDNETDISTLQDIWMSLVQSQGEYEDLGRCEQCGDYISKWTVNIE